MRDLGYLGEADAFHINYAREQNYVLVTSDTDFLKMVADGVEHRDIVFAAYFKYSLGEWVEHLNLLCEVYTPEDILNHY